MKPIALQLYTVREQMKQDLPGTLKQVANFGYVGVEGLPGGQPREAKRILDDLGLKATSLHWAPATPDNIQEIVDAAGLLDIHVVCSGWKNREDWDSPDGVRRIAAGIQESAALLKAHGLIHAYHNHWWEMQDLDGTLGLERFLAAAPDAGSELDVYWACNFGAVDVPALLGRWKTRCPVLHIKDGPLVRDEPHTAVGAGKMDIPAVVAAADEDVCQWLIVELDRCATDIVAAAKDSLDYLVANGLGRARD